MPIAFYFHSTDTQSKLTVARHMVAFRKATERLKEYYEKLQETPTVPSVVPPHMFPYPTGYKSLNDNTPKRFQYGIELVDDKLVFSGTEDNGDNICIKFVQTYSCDAHKCLASLGRAPALRGFEKIHGGWFMVVMDLLPEDYETLSQRKDPLSTSFFNELSKVLNHFHDAGFVHGDIRDANTMVFKNDETKFMIIDFDWSGRVGEARYPADVNHMEIERPEDAQDGLEILKDHDLHMLKIIQKNKVRD